MSLGCGGQGGPRWRKFRKASWNQSFAMAGSDRERGGGSKGEVLALLIASFSSNIGELRVEEVGIVGICLGRFWGRFWRANGDIALHLHLLVIPIQGIVVVIYR